MEAPVADAPARQEEEIRNQKLDIRRKTTVATPLQKLNVVDDIVLRQGLTDGKNRDGGAGVAGVEDDLMIVGNLKAVGTRFVPVNENVGTDQPCEGGGIFRAEIAPPDEAEN